MNTVFARYDLEKSLEQVRNKDDLWKLFLEQYPDKRAIEELKKYNQALGHNRYLHHIDSFRDEHSRWPSVNQDFAKMRASPLMQKKEVPEYTPEMDRASRSWNELASKWSARRKRSSARSRLRRLAKRLRSSGLLVEAAKAESLIPLID